MTEPKKPTTFGFGDFLMRFNENHEYKRAKKPIPIKTKIRRQINQAAIRARLVPIITQTRIKRESAPQPVK